MISPARAQSLERAGRYLLPGAFGLLIGFYAADRGLRLLPTALVLGLSVALFALLLLAFGRHVRMRSLDGAARLRARWQREARLGAAAVAAGCLVATLWAARPSPLTLLSDAAFATAFQQDLRRYREHDSGMERILRTLERPELRIADDDVLSADQERLLLDSWVAFLDYAIALDHIRAFYEDYYRFDPSRHGRRSHLRSFLLTFAAELALYEKAARFDALIAESKNSLKFLDAPHPSRGLAEGSVSRLRERLLGSRDQARIIAGKRYLEVLEHATHGRHLAKSMGIDGLWRGAEQHLAIIDAVAPIKRVAITVSADLQELERGLRHVWFPIQKEAAEVLGDTRVRRIGWYLIDEELRAAVDKKLHPGDILLSRKNWYLSNVGLPGFWPHAILYLGTPNKLRDFFDDPEVASWLSEQGIEGSFADHLQSRFPSAWASYQQQDHGEPHRVIEAISEGVVFSTLGHCAGDYLAALRPKLDKRAKAQAVLAAFGHFGKPYDFDFDFATDHALVCTELVWRAYRGADGKQGIEMPLATVAGRQTLPANDIARIYAEQAEAGETQLEFVVFVDAREKQRQAFLSNEEAFRATHRRPKWDISQR